MAVHILRAAPDSAKVIFENELVRVVLITMKKGKKIPMHSHNRGLSYSLNRGKIRSTNKEGKAGTFSIEEGEISWSDRDGQETHAVENLGGVLRELSVEFK